MVVNTEGLAGLSAELVVAESVVVIKKLLQMQPEKHSDIIKHMAKLTDNIQVHCVHIHSMKWRESLFFSRHLNASYNYKVRKSTRKVQNFFCRFKKETSVTHF